MAENTKIEWAGATFNPWRGCVEVSEGCDNCYARQQAGRNPTVLGRWGKDGTRVIASAASWREPTKWNGKAQQQGEPTRVFCASLADVFEDWPGQMACADGRLAWLDGMGVYAHTPDPLQASPQPGIMPTPYRMNHARQRLWSLIRQTPWLRWLLLTKRPGNIRPMLPARGMGGFGSPLWGSGSRDWYPEEFKHVWFGTTAENQARADERIPVLANVPARLRFLSCEPLLGPIDLSPYLTCSVTDDKPIGWVIVGGESVGGRPCHVDWVEEIVECCRQHGVACFVKQLGSNPQVELAGGMTQLLRLTDKRKGGQNTDEWPPHLAVRQVPDV